MDLAERVGVHQSSIAQFESGDKQPSSETLEAISLQTGLPPAFFRQTNEPPEFPSGSLLYRAKRSQMKKRDRAQAYRFGELLFEAAMKLAERAAPAPVRLPQLDDEDPEMAAAMTRSALGIGPDGPVRNLLNVAERGGVLVLAVPLFADPIDAFSVWAKEFRKPVIVLFSNVPGDRLRLNVAHELGHLVMHRALRGDVERDAFRFARALLIPEQAMRDELKAPVGLTELARMKARWGVSMQAIAMGARDIGIITDRQLKYIFQQLGARGWRRREPANLDIPTEKPRTLRRMAEVLYGDPIDYRALGADLALSPAFLEDVLSRCATRRELPKVETPQSEAPAAPNNVLRFPRRS